MPVEALYSWRTPLRPHAFLSKCPSVAERGGFFGFVEVVVFPNSSGYIQLSAETYIGTGEVRDSDATAVRFNADPGARGKSSPVGPDAFSIIWTPTSTPTDPEAVGMIHAVGAPGLAQVMREMINGSKTSQTDVDDVMATVRTLNGEDPPSRLRPRTGAGLVKLIGVPGTNLRLVSRLDEELMRPGGNLSHEVVLAAATPEAVDDAQGLECEVTVFPKGWVTMTNGPHEVATARVNVPVEPDWGRPQDGRKGPGSLYVFEALVAAHELSLSDSPPAAPRPAGGRRHADVRIRLLCAGEVVCRLDHPFWVEPAGQPSAFAESIERLIDSAGLTEDDIAEAAGVPSSDVVAWSHDEAEPTAEERDRVRELTFVVDRMAGVLRPEAIPAWLHRQIPLLGGETPLDLICRRESDAVRRLVAGLESPAAS